MVKGTSHCKKNLSRHNMILTISLLINGYLNECSSEYYLRKHWVTQIQWLVKE